MAVVIRLQGLPVSAGSVDIRHFFSGLIIPDGGVHIIGGKLGEAFIIFATDEDARRAMSRTGGQIKNSRVELLLSSKSEMQSTLETSRKNNRKHPAVPTGGDVSKAATGPKKGNQNKFDKNNSEADSDSRGKRNTYTAKGGQKKSDDIYLFLYGLPYSATEEDVRKFFNGINVVQIIFLLRQNGAKNGNALVKFANAQDATAAMAHDNEYMGDRYISIKKTSEEQWIMAGGLAGGAQPRQPKRQRSRSRSPPQQQQQFYVHLKNLSHNMEKEDTKRFLGLPDLPDAQIKFLLDNHQNRTREGFILVRSEWQYEKCLAMNGISIAGHPVFVAPISRKEMLNLIESSESPAPLNQSSLIGNYQNSGHSNMKRWVYLRNFPFDVSKAEVQRFFSGFPVHPDDIVLLFDSKGLGLGEALVKFPSEEQALLAERLDRQPFLGTEVFLRRISDEQVKEFGAFDEPARNVLPNSQMFRNEFLSREPLEPPFPMSEDLAYGRRDFRGSPERFRGPHPMEFSVPNKRGRFDMGGENSMDYPLPLPGRNQGFEGRNQGFEGRNQGFEGRNQGFEGRNQGFEGRNQGFEGRNQGFEGRNQGFEGRNQGFEGHNQNQDFEEHNQDFEGRSDLVFMRMKNLPFTVTVVEILDFFYGYNVIQDSVDIKFNNKGMSTGNATVCFRNYDEAVAAVDELNERPIGARKIGLTILNK